MDDQDKLTITRNLSSLIDSTQFSSALETKLLEKNVFTAAMLERMRGTATDSHSQKRRLFTDVQKRGPAAFSSLLAALAESGNLSAAQILNPGMVEVEDTEDRGLQQPPAQGQGKVWNPPVYAQTPAPAAPSPPVWHNNTTPLAVKVVRSGQGKREEKNPAIKHYTMESEPRGLMLIINNEDFDNDVLTTRTGSLVDANNLDQLFLQLGFSVTLRRNLGYTDMIMEIQKFAARTDHEHVDMCAVAIMSHGRHGLVAAADGRELETEWVLRQFNNEGCPRLRGKPKLFILQCCRGDEADYGVLPKISFPEARVESDARALAPGSTGATRGGGGNNPDVYREVTWEDMVVAYATLPGYVANRDTYRGTWFVECLCKVFMENAHQLEVREMLDIVAEKLRQFESENGTKQSCAYEVRNFYKKLYFNP